VIAHSHFVGDKLSRLAGRTDIEILPLPLPLGLLDLLGSAPSVLTPSAEPVALHFGNLHRDYKGSATVLELARRGVTGWRLALVGKGAPESADGGETVGRFLEPAELVATVAGSAATLLPYVQASQSAAVVLAQALGSVVIASGVGGIPEQIENGVTGWLVAPDAPIEAWVDALSTLSRPADRSRLSAAAASSVHSDHLRFVSGIAELPG
jgi:glycosyltransferase involved in cell wall biosynthesis